MKRYLAAAAVAGLVVLGGSPAFADDTPDCKDIGHQVITYADPYDLDDEDADNIGCENYPGPATALDIDDPTLKGEPELAHTGAWGPATHPLRWMGFSAGLVLAGGASLAMRYRLKTVDVDER